MATEDKNKAKKETSGGDTYSFHDSSMMNGGHGGYHNFDNATMDNNNHSVHVHGDKLTPEELEQFADWLRKERKEKKMTQKDVADKTGIDLKYYQKLESRKLAIEPRLGTFNRLAKFFGYEGISVLAKKKSGFESNILKTTQA